MFCQYTETLVHLVFCQIQVSSLSVASVPILSENRMYLNFFYSWVFVDIDLVR